MIMLQMNKPMDTQYRFFIFPIFSASCPIPLTIVNSLIKRMAMRYVSSYLFFLLTWVVSVVKILMCTRKCTNRLQYSVCKCEVESTGKWSNIGVLFNQPHFNLVPKV
jgi:hypothetical protein